MNIGSESVTTLYPRPANGWPVAWTRQNVRRRLHTGLAALCLFVASASASSAQITVGGPEKQADWSGLSQSEAEKGLPVEIKGMVVCYDRPWGQFYVYDGHRAIYLDPRLFTNSFRVGQQVRIQGNTAWSQSASVLTNVTCTILGQAPLPAAPRLKVRDLAGSSGQWVELKGRIRVAEASHGRTTFILKDGDEKCLIYVMQTSDTNPIEAFADADVTIQGVNASQPKPGNGVSAVVFCPGPDQVRILTPTGIDRWHQPVIPIDTLLTRPLGAWTNNPVHINGVTVDYQAGGSLTIQDPSGILRAEVIQIDPLLLNQRVDCWGFLAIRTNGVALADALFRNAVKAPVEAPAPIARQAAGKSQLTSIREIRALSKSEANKNFPVLVKGVITFVDAEWRMGFLQAGPDAIYFDAAETNLAVGDWVEVRGETDGGGFAPDLIHCTTTVLGRGQLPPPQLIGLQDAVSGQLDSAWVEMEGVVRQVAKQYGHIALALSGRDGKFSATVLDPGDAPAPGELIDSRVRIRGACGSLVNSRGQLSGVMLHVSGRDQITVVDPSAADPFIGSEVPIAQVATFSRGRSAGRRIKINGVVTVITSARNIFVQDDSGGMRVLNAGTNNLRLGDHVDVVGFPALFEFSPALEEAAVRVLGTTNLPSPLKTTAAQVLQNGACDGSLVELEAEMVQSYAHSARPKLLFQQGPIVFAAQMALPQLQTSLPDWPAGSLVRLRGVCVIQGDENNEPANFHLLLADSSALTLVKGASWWTLTHTLILLGGTTFASCMALLWGFLLQTQVRKQTEIIRQNQQRLVETSRLAGMAEIATNVLHNVGNVLNSVNISASIVIDNFKKTAGSRGLADVVALMEEHPRDLGDFITKDPRGKHVPLFLKQLADRARAENATAVGELTSLQKNIEHIKDIVARQQSLAKIGGVLENVSPCDIMEDALMAVGNLERSGITIKRVYGPGVERFMTEKHKLLQILVNLISNARNACVESGIQAKEITLGVEQADGDLKMWVQDNGVGIPPENLVRIFHHGFTTRKTGHGFGLHSGALYAQEMGGQLSVHSNGHGLGARFTLTIPVDGVIGPGTGETA